MAVKYRCTKCEKKFVEWGLDKVKSGEACEECKGENLELIVFDATQTTAKKKPTLKRAKKKAKAAKPAPLPTYTDDDQKAPDLNTIGGSAVAGEGDETPTPSGASDDDSDDEED